MVAKFYGKSLPQSAIRERCNIERDGTSILNLSTAADELGFKSNVERIACNDISSVQLPLIAFWRNGQVIE